MAVSSSGAVGRGVGSDVVRAEQRVSAIHSLPAPAINPCMYRNGSRG